MKQETGSNKLTNHKVVSIRVTSSGHNFSSHTPSTTSSNTTIIIESAKAMLLPTILIESASPQEHLLSVGIAIDTTIDEAIIIKHDDITSAIVVVPQSLHEIICNTYGNEAKYTTPLLAKAPTTGHDLLVHLSPDQTLLCLNLYNGKDLIFAELFEVKNYSDVLYWISRIGEEYDLSTYTIYIDGGENELEKLLNKFYKSVKKCE